MNARSEAARTAVGAVAEPLLGRPLADLGLVENVRRATGGGLVVDVRALLSEPGHLAAVRERIEDALAGVPGGGRARVRVTPLDATARAGLARRLRGENRRPGGPGDRTRIYAVGSGKGGVGKSSITANLAVALAASGRRVALLDADVWGYSVPQLFGVRQAPVALDGMMLPVTAHGVRLMSIGFFVREEEPVVWRGPMLRKALEQFLTDVYWGEPDVLLIDLPPGTGDVPLTVLELLPQAALVVVTTPQRTAELVAARVGRMALDARMPVAGVIENMTGSAFGGDGGVRLAATLGAPLLGRIRLDAAWCDAGDAGVPLPVSRPDSPAAGDIRDIADRLPEVRPSLVRRPLPLHVG